MSDLVFKDPTNLGTNQCVLIRGVTSLWGELALNLDFAKRPEYTGVAIQIRGNSLHDNPIHKSQNTNSASNYIKDEHGMDKLIIGGAHSTSIHIQGSE